MGVIEVLYDVDAGVWGTVCNTTWNSTDAQVACKSLGYTDGESYIATTLIFSTHTCIRTSAYKIYTMYELDQNI